MSISELSVLFIEIIEICLAAFCEETLKVGSGDFQREECDNSIQWVGCVYKIYIQTIFTESQTTFVFIRVLPIMMLQSMFPKDKTPCRSVWSLCVSFWLMFVLCLAHPQLCSHADLMSSSAETDPASTASNSATKYMTASTKATRLAV